MPLNNLKNVSIVCGPWRASSGRGQIFNLFWGVGNNTVFFLFYRGLVKNKFKDSLNHSDAIMEAHEKMNNSVCNYNKACQ